MAHEGSKQPVTLSSRLIGLIDGSRRPEQDAPQEDDINCDSDGRPEGGIDESRLLAGE